MHLSEIFDVKGRFYRSVHVEHDSSIDDYIVTQTTLNTIEQITDALGSDKSTKAFSLIGPYGSGKSAFIVFLKNLLGPQNFTATTNARQLLEKSDHKLSKRFSELKCVQDASKNGFCLAVTSAGREPIEKSLIKGLIQGLESYTKQPSPTAIRLIASLKRDLKACNRGSILSNDDVLDRFNTAINIIKKSQGGLFLVVDELGKCLEKASHDTAADIFVLQKLAEFSSRSSVPFVFMTVLHQAFDRYASRLDSEKRNEWAKIQGRFKDLSFINTSDQVFRLISSAITKINAKSAQELTNVWNNKNAKYLKKLFSEDKQKNTEKYHDLINECAPLHPIATIVLPHLFKGKFSQNERSLFTFLSSQEPHGFVEYLNTTSRASKGSTAQYSCYHLYDYFVSAFGMSLFVQSNGKKWVEIDSALNRTTDQLERMLIKSLGLLGITSDALSIKVDEKLIDFALSSSGSTKAEIHSALQALKRKSIIVFRRYSSSYQLWGGSDINIEELIDSVKKNELSRSNIISALNELFPIRSKVAKKHLFETGTLRYFDARYCDYHQLENELKIPISGSDGQILFVINTDDQNKVKPSEVYQLLKGKTDKEISKKTIIALASDSTSMTSVFEELLALQWIKRHTPELQGDEVARREIEARLLQLERIIEGLSQSIFFDLNTSNASDSYWISVYFKDEQPIKNISKKDVSTLISSICDKVYSGCPTIKNELVNRNKISSTAMAARRVLLHAMFDNAVAEDLNFKSFPPEKSMYLSVLKHSKLHHLGVHDKWEFASSSADIEKSWRKTWDALLGHLEKNEFRKVPIKEIYEILTVEPYGIKEGILPILIVALLKGFESEIALFENGSFLPQIKLADIDLLSKRPQDYSIQLCRISGIKENIFNEITSSFIEYDDTCQGNRKSAMMVVKALCSFVSNLPTYVKKTDDVSKAAKEVRYALLHSTEPATLLYRELPLACGFLNATDRNSFKSSDTKAYVSKLRECLSELQRKESDLFHKVEMTLVRVFDLDIHQKNVFDDMRLIAGRLVNYTADQILKGFLERVADTKDSHSHKEWIRSVGANITKRSPMEWSDHDLTSFEHQVLSMAVSIQRHLRLDHETELQKKSSVNGLMTYHLWFAAQGMQESALISLSPKDLPTAENLGKDILEWIGSNASKATKEEILIALTKASIELMNQCKSKNYKSRESSR